MISKQRKLAATLAALIKGKAYGGMIKKDKLYLMAPDEEGSAKIDRGLHDQLLITPLVDFNRVAHRSLDLSVARPHRHRRSP